MSEIEITVSGPALQEHLVEMITEIINEALGVKDLKDWRKSYQPSETGRYTVFYIDTIQKLFEKRQNQDNPDDGQKTDDIAQQLKQINQRLDNLENDSIALGDNGVRITQRERILTLEQSVLKLQKQITYMYPGVPVYQQLVPGLGLMQQHMHQTQVNAEVNKPRQIWSLELPPHQQAEIVRLKQALNNPHIENSEVKVLNAIKDHLDFISNTMIFSSTNWQGWNYFKGLIINIASQCCSVSLSPAILFQLEQGSFQAAYRHLELEFERDFKSSFVATHCEIAKYQSMMLAFYQIKKVPNILREIFTNK